MCGGVTKNWIRLHLCVEGVPESADHGSSPEDDMDSESQIEPNLNIVILEISDDAALDNINQYMWTLSPGQF